MLLVLWLCLAFVAAVEELCSGQPNGGDGSWKRGGVGKSWMMLCVLGFSCIAVSIIATEHGGYGER